MHEPPSRLSHVTVVSLSIYQQTTQDAHRDIALLEVSVNVDALQVLAAAAHNCMSESLAVAG